jgi:basic membrane lipoprotein Med (substrate-binding protein (PBP1-ABC) superfamily)
MGQGEKVENVAVLLPASRTDQGWNQQAADSMMAVQKELGFNFEVAENLGYDDITPVLRTWPSGLRPADLPRPLWTFPDL